MWAFRISEAHWKSKGSRSSMLIGSPPAGGDQEMIDLLDQLL